MSSYEAVIRALMWKGAKGGFGGGSNKEQRSRRGRQMGW